MNAFKRLVLFVCAFAWMFDISVSISYEQELLDRLLLNSSYDKRFAPSRASPDSGPTLVTVTMVISDIFEVNVNEMDFSMTVYFRQIWNDQRLQFDESFGSLELTHESMAKLWKPDTFFEEFKSGFQHSVLEVNELMHISPNGTIINSKRFTLKLSCFMDFKLYPLDKQTCTISIGSYGSMSNVVIYQWEQLLPVSILGTSLSLYKIPDTIPVYNEMIEYYLYSHPFSLLKMELEFKRSIGYYFIEFFIPDMLIVILSWVSFWLHPDSVPARISLGCVTVLTISSQSSMNKANAPKVSYIKASDVWTLFQILFVFSAMVEYSAVNVLSRTKRTISFPKIFGVAIQTDTCTKDKPYFSRAKKIDTICRAAFPIAYLIFNGVFWGVLFYLQS